MAVRIRLARHGRLHRPFFRIVAIEGRNAREGETCEILGTYDPLLKDKNITVDLAAVQRWIGQGASISDGLRSLLKVHGYALPVAPATATKAQRGRKPVAKRAPGKKGEKQPFVAASRRAKLKHAAKLKAERKAKLAAEAAAKAAAPAADAPAADAPKA
jgi:small subunit ribosomal protein S16